MNLRAIFLLIALTAGASGLVAQVPLGSRVTDFVAPNTDSLGRQSVIRGANAEPAGPGILRITKPRVESLRADKTVDMTIDAAECFYDFKNSHDIWSDKEISLKTDDSRLSLKGVGFRFSNSHLSISNKIDAIIRQQEGQGSVSGTNSIRITSDSLEHFVDSVIFNGNVTVVDRHGQVRCGILKAKFDKKSNLQDIEAFNNVILSQEKTEAGGDRAFYSQISGLLRLFGNTQWKMGDLDGQSELLILDRTNSTLRAEGKVEISLPFSLLTTNRAAETLSRNSTNRLAISADTFDYAPTNISTLGPIAIFNGDVRAIDPQTSLDCQLLTIFFDSTNRLVRAVADRNVEITRVDGLIKSTIAVFENDEITVPKNPSWRLKDSTGTAELLVFNPRTREVRAERKVRMEVPLAAGTNLFLSTSSSNLSSNAHNVLTVYADYFTNKNGIATFSSNVRVTELRGQIDANKIALHFDSSNRVQSAIAEGDVILTSDKFQATGQRADYNVSNGIARLTGTPKVTSEGSESIAREFIVDFVNHERQPLPPFQIKVSNRKRK